MSQMTGRPFLKGYLGRITDGEVVAMFQFRLNPTEVTRARSVDYVFNSPPGSPLPTALFKSIQGDTFTIQLLLDEVETYTVDKKGTSAQKAVLEAFTQPDSERFSDDLGQFISPPMVRYGMGEESWECVMLSVSFRDVRWNADGHPTRTYADIQLRSVYTNIATLRARLDQLIALRDQVSVDWTET